MNLLICDGPAYPRGKRRYRGTYRAVPSFCDTRPQEDEINRLFGWYLDEGGESGVVHDLARATRFAALWNEHLGRSAYEVIEVTDGLLPAENEAKCMGFDLSIGHCFSLLGALGGTVHPSLEDHLQTLTALMNEHFVPLLNDYGLFSTYDSDSFCLRVMKALQTLHPALFESGDLSGFKVVGVHLVYPRSGESFP